ncbi:MAG: hypothetical protein MZV64_45285 [Ignavibacteriales bacterium]|nr:hypothetical protein [Ignavibacteriales bacterium]
MESECRVDSGFASDSEISIHYDPMIAKLICWDRDRNKTIQRMNRALNEFQIAGITTNIKFLNYILNTDKFSKGDYDINFIDNLNYTSLLEDNLSQSKNEHETAASILAALIKSKKKSGQIVNSSVKIITGGSRIMNEFIVRINGSSKQIKILDDNFVEVDNN